MTVILLSLIPFAGLVIGFRAHRRRRRAEMAAMESEAAFVDFDDRIDGVPLPDGEGVV